MITIIENDLTIDVYQRLRRDSGLSTKSRIASQIGLANTLYSVALKNEQGGFIGMGRVIGDGGCFCQIVDICVLPSYQGKGLGYKIMEKITSYIDNSLPESCYISLFADGKASNLYVKFGFRESLPHSKGMFIKK